MQSSAKDRDWSSCECACLVGQVEKHVESLNGSLSLLLVAKNEVDPAGQLTAHERRLQRLVEAKGKEGSLVRGSDWNGKQHLPHSPHKFPCASAGPRR